MNWEPTKAKYMTGENLVSGKIVLMEVFYDSLSSKDKIERWAVRSRLPNMPGSKENLIDRDAAKTEAERRVSVWFREVGVQGFPAIPKKPSKGD